MADINQIIRVYGRLLRKNVRLKALAEKAYRYTDAQEFATKAAETMFDVLKMYIDPTDIGQDEAIKIFTTVLQSNYQDVARICAKVQNNINRSANLGIRALTPEFNMEKAEGLAKAITDAKNVTDDYVENLMINNARGVVDESIKKNMEAQENMGLRVHIVRRYDDVGLHGGKDVCQWCMDRVGEWDNYRDAYEAGAFERHPGCGCYIEYHVGKTHTWQSSKGVWNDM